MRSFIADAPAPAADGARVPAVGAGAPPRRCRPAAQNFRFYDNRQKYLLFVTTCSEKWVIAQRVGMELAHIHPRPPALRVFDAGTGDGTVLARTMRAMHQRFPTMPFYIVGKEISLEDVRLVLEKMPDRLFEHPATVLVMTNLYYSEAPWLKPNSVTAATSLVWHELPLVGNTAMTSRRRSAACSRFSPSTGGPASAAAATRSTKSRWCSCSTARTTNSCSIRCGRAAASPRPNTIWSSPRSPIAPAPRSNSRRAASSPRWRAASAPGGRLIAIHAHGDDPGLEIIRRIWPGEDPFTTDRHALLRATKAELGSAGRALNFGAYADARALFRYDMHTLPSEISETIGTSTLFAAWNAAVYVAQIEDRRLSRGDQQRRLSRRHPRGAAPPWRAVVLGRILRDLAQARFAMIGAGGEALPKELAWPGAAAAAARAAAGGGADRGRLGRAVAARGSRRGGAAAHCCRPGPRCSSTIRRAPPITTSLPPAAGCAGPAWCRCRISRRGGYRASPSSTTCLRRAAAEAAVERVLIVAGDPDRPVGPFRDSLDLLASGAWSATASREVSFAVYPERHPRIGDPALDAALDAKLELARRRGLKPSLVTQFGFAAAPIAARIAALRARGIACPIAVGIAGPGNVATLAKFAIRCGVGASLQALARGETALARVRTRHHPRRADPGPRRRRSAVGADRRPAHLHLRRPAPDRPVAARPARTGRGPGATLMSGAGPRYEGDGRSLTQALQPAGPARAHSAAPGGRRSQDCGSKRSPPSSKPLSSTST